MTLTLTTEDLKAIGDIVEDKLETVEIRTANGFDELHKQFNKLDAKFNTLDTKFDSLDTKVDKLDHKVEALAGDLQDVKQTVGRIEMIQRAEIKDVDQHSEDIKLIKSHLKLA